MKLSITIPFTANDKPYNDLLTKSIKETVSLSNEEYEIVPHENDGVGLTGSLAHAIGLTEGYKKCKGEMVLFLDSDTYFFKKNWDKELLEYFDDPDTVLAGGKIEAGYETPFFRCFFLAVRSSFYKNFITNEKGFFPKYSDGKQVIRGFPSGNHKMINDTGYAIMDHCTENNKKYIQFKNSLNHDVPSIYNKEEQGPHASGETIYDSKGDPFFHHVGRGTFKSYRFTEWEKFINKIL